MRPARLPLPAVLFAILIATAAHAQGGPVSVIFPAPVDPWRSVVSVGATVTVLPRPIAEEEIRQIPMLDVGARLGLPYGGSVVGHVATNYLVNRAALGLQWSYAIDNYSLTVGDEISYWYGSARIEGFDASAFGWMTVPYIALGADFEELRLLLRADRTYVLYRRSRVGDEEVALADEHNAGTAFTAAIEQPFIDGNEVSLGVRVNITDEAVESWLAFSTFRDKLVYPELFFSVIL